MAPLRPPVEPERIHSTRRKRADGDRNGAAGRGTYLLDAPLRWHPPSSVADRTDVRRDDAVAILVGGVRATSNGLIKLRRKDASLNRVRPKTRNLALSVQGRW